MSNTYVNIEQFVRSMDEGRMIYGRVWISKDAFVALYLQAYQDWKIEHSEPISLNMRFGLIELQYTAPVCWMVKIFDDYLETFINRNDPYGGEDALHLLKRQEYIPVFLFKRDKLVRRIKISNSLMKAAGYIADYLRSRKWTNTEFNRGINALYSLYPTPKLLWDKLGESF